MTCNVECTFLSIHIFISDSIFNFRWKSVIYFIFCAPLLRLFLRYILKAIWKFRHWYLSISIDTAKLFWKDKTFMTNTTLVLIYLAPVSFCYSYSFLPYTQIYWCYRKKFVWIFGAPIHQHLKKIFAMKIIFKYIYRPFRRAKDHSPR